MIATKWAFRLGLLYGRFLWRFSMDCDKICVMKSDQQSTATIKCWLQKKRRQEELNESIQVSIREIIASPHDNVYSLYSVFSEFHGNSGAGRSKEQLASESQASLIARVIKHIDEIARIANTKHLEENFIFTIPDGAGSRVATYKLRENKMHEITRLSFPEFYFYPYEKRGPYTWDGFNQLMQHCEKLAGSYAENFHMILGTIPVKDDANVVHNVGVYIQCGKQPRMNVFTKANPHTNDYQYPDTTSIFITSGSMIERLVHEINNLSRKLVSSVIAGNRDNAFLLIEQLKKACVSNSDYNYEDKQADPKIYISEIRSILFLLDEIKDQLARGFSWEDARLKQDVNHVHHLIKHFRNEILAQQTKYFTVLQSLIKKKKIASTQFYHDKQVEGIMHFGGRIVCETAGGKKFITYVDICYDYQVEFAFLLNDEMIKQQMIAFSEPIITLGSQVVVSNSIDLVNYKFLGKTISHVDPAHIELAALTRDDLKKYTVLNEVRPKRIRGYASKDYGSDGKIYFFEPHKLRRTTRHAGLVKYYHRYLTYVKAFELLREKSPNKVAIDAQINKFKLLVMCRIGHVNSVRKLLDENADYHYRDNLGVSAKEYALRYTELIELFLAKGVGFEKEIERAVRHHKYVLTRLYKAYAALNQSHKVLFAINRHSSAQAKRDLLRAAIKARRPDDVTYLLAIGADLFMTSKHHEQPIKKVLRYHHTDILKTIYNHLCSLNQDEHIYLAVSRITHVHIIEEIILLAITNERQLIVERLAAHDSSSNITTNTIKQMIAASIRWGNLRLVRAVYDLLSYHDKTSMIISAIDMRTSDKIKSQLLIAALYMDIKIDVLRLLEMNADPTYELKYGKSAIKLAVEKSLLSYLKMFYQTMRKNGRGEAFVCALVETKINPELASMASSFLLDKREQKLLHASTKPKSRHRLRC